MRYTKLYAPTLKEDPADADVVSHRLLVRAGMIRQVARGVYDFLPLALRTLRKIEAIIREELDSAGCQEVLLPVVCPAELWQESGRWSRYGKELLRLRDRHDRDFCIGPTHEEVITDLVRRDVRSYRDLPLNLYQIQTKFRDEVRPRFGLMRGREFVMKDGYSFHPDYESCRLEYERMRDVYSRIFRRCGLEFRVVEADTGNIGGTMSHEFQVLADSGEDRIVSCNHCDYAANVEKAVARPKPQASFERAELAEIATPDVRTIDEVSAFLDQPAERFIKTLVFVAAGDGVAVLLRGDEQLSEAKLKAVLSVEALRLAEPEEVEQLTGAAQGFAGPVGLGLRTIADSGLAGCTGMISGANKKDTHLTGLEQERDFPAVELADLRMVVAGDLCARCSEGTLDEYRGIEVGQVFYLGSKYSKALGATYLDAQGNEKVMEMGTYGIGVTRTLAAAIEQHHDERGVIWPVAIAPYEVVIVPVKWEEARTAQASESLYRALLDDGIDVLLDDRAERAGVKFNDADLLGIPVRATIGPRGLKSGTIELKLRREEQGREIAIEEAAAEIAMVLREERAA